MEMAKQSRYPFTHTYQFRKVIAMDFSFFVKGLIFGFAIAAPVGPIGILCIQRSLSGGWTSGMMTGLGAASADAIYGSLAGFGLAGLTAMVVGQREWIQLFGGCFLCYLGLRIFLTVKEASRAPEVLSDAPKGYFSALLLTLTNPMTILSFTAVFAGMGLGREGTGPLEAVGLVAGVFTGSTAWWVILTTFSSLLRHRMNGAWMTWINRISGSVLAGFGLVMVIGHFYASGH